MAMFGRSAFYYQLHQARQVQHGALTAGGRRRHAPRVKYSPEVGMLLRLASVVLAAMIVIALVRPAAN